MRLHAKYVLKNGLIIVKRIRNVQMATPCPSHSQRGDPCSVVPWEPIISANNADTGKVRSCICSITDFLLWVYQYPWLLDFRGHHGSHNGIFIYWIWMKFGKCLHSIIVLLGLVYFLCVFFRDCQDTGLGTRLLHVHRTQHTLRSHRLCSLMPLRISKTC